MAKTHGHQQFLSTGFQRTLSGTYSRLRLNMECHWLCFWFLLRLYLSSCRRISPICKLSWVPSQLMLWLALYMKSNWNSLQLQIRASQTAKSSLLFKWMHRNCSTCHPSCQLWPHFRSPYRFALVFCFIIWDSRSSQVLGFSFWVWYWTSASPESWHAFKSNIWQGKTGESAARQNSSTTSRWLNFTLG